MWTLRLAAFLLPFLDSPLVPGDSFVRPLALYPIFFGLLALFTLKIRIVFSRGLTLWSPYSIFSFFVLFSLTWTSVLHIANAIRGPTLELSGYTFVAFSARASIALLMGWACYTYFVFAMHTKEEALAACKWALLGALTQALIALVQALAATLGGYLLELYTSLGSWLAYRGNLANRRAFGVAPEPSIMADYLLVVAFPLALAALKFGGADPMRLNRVRIWGYLLLLGASLILSFSRAGIAGLGVALIIFLLISRATKYVDQNAVGLGKFGIALTLVILLFVGTFSERFQGAVSTLVVSQAWSEEGGVVSNITRLGNITAALSIFRDHVFGVGLGGYPYYYADHVPEWALWSHEIQMYLGHPSVHGAVIEQLPNAKALVPRVLAETGIIGVLVLAIFYTTALRHSWQTLRTTEIPLMRFLSCVATLGLILMIPMSFNLDSYVIPHYYFIFAIVEFTILPKAAQHHGS